MEVSQVPKLASHFWPKFLKQKITIVVIVQFVLSIIVGVALVCTNTLPIDSIILWTIVISLLLLGTISSLLILISVTKPTKDLLAAVLSVSGEKSSLTPPNPNNEAYERSGFRDALQTIYELSNKDNGLKSTSNEDQSDSELHTISNALNMTICGFIALDKDRNIIYCNKSAPTHIDNDGKKIIDLLFNGNDTLDVWLDSCKNNSVHAERTWTRVPDRLPNLEDRRFFDVLASYEKGVDVETVLTLIDRTSSYIVDEENLDFISFAAHELRGPITVIRGYLDVLNDELSSVFVNDQQELFNRLIVSSNRLSGYVDNILNTSRYDRKHLKMNLSEDSFTSIYDSISDDIKLRASAQKRLLTVDIPTNLPTIAADRTSIGEVLSNLIDNAIKYSNDGGIVKIYAQTNGDFVDLSVTDNGIGMPESVISQLFQKFYRSHRSRETVAGTGIGLYISKAIVESHGGTISVRSEDGKGSTFTISIPIYETVADKLKANDNSNEGIINEGKGWIKNHSMYRS